MFHVYPSGTFVSVRQQEVKTIVPISTSAAEKTNPAKRIVAIGNLAMEGGSSQGGLQNASARASAQRGGQAGTNPYDGTTWAWEPANALVASPGAPPMAPQ